MNGSGRVGGEVVSHWEVHDAVNGSSGASVLPPSLPPSLPSFLPRLLELGNAAAEEGFGVFVTGRYQVIDLGGRERGREGGREVQS